MTVIDDLVTAVAAEDTVIDSVLVLLSSLSAALVAAGTDKAKLQAVIDGINNKSAAISAAVVANTPAATP